MIKATNETEEEFDVVSRRPKSKSKKQVWSRTEAETNALNSLVVPYAPGLNKYLERIVNFSTLAVSSFRNYKSLLEVTKLDLL